MEFYKKLDNLMKTQGVSNSRLARSLSVDPSLVSRWRTGARKPAKNNEYVRDISVYFASRAKMEYQKLAIFEIMGMEYKKEHENINSIAKLLYTWLSEKKYPESLLINGFFKKLEGSKDSNISLPDLDGTSSHLAIKSDIEILKGIEGKRKGVLKFLSAVAASEELCTMLLYSDEDMEWLMGDKNYYIKWGTILMNVLAKGHKIKIIHTVNRDLSEMLSAIEHWLPLYMTGKIEPYYYPKYQQHIFRRTMFIAPGIAALSSSTIATHTNKAEQFLYTDRKIINNLTEEFKEYLNICRPLMRIFTEENAYNFSKLQTEYEIQTGDYISLSDSLSFITMPEALLINKLKENNKSEEISERILSMHRERRDIFKTQILNNKYTEIIHLPDNYQSFTQKNIRANDFFLDLDLSYTPLEYCQHLDNIIRVLKKYHNYSLLICDKIPAQNTYLTAKDEVGVIIAKNDSSPTIFAFNQQDMTNTFNIYLNDIIKRIHKSEKNKKYVIEKLKNIKGVLSSS